MKRSPATPSWISRPRPSRLGLGVLALALGGFGVALVDGLTGDPDPGATLRPQVAAWGLTDLALHTEARYTRHPSQADRHAAFQDHPGAREHFPSGALVPPPPHLRVPVAP